MAYLVPLLTFIFSSASTTIAGFALIALHLACGGDRPEPSWVGQAGVVLIGIGFITILFFKARTAVLTGEPQSAKEVVSHALVGLAGGGLAIAKVWYDAYQSGRTLQFDLATPFYMLAIIVCVFVVVALLSRKAGKVAGVKFAETSYRIAVAVLIAGFAGTLVQLIFVALGWFSGRNIPVAECSEKHLHGFFRFGTTDFFISAPMTAFLFALFAAAAVAIVASRPAKSRTKAAKIIVAMVVAALLSACYATTYFSQQWHTGFKILVLLALQMPAVWGAILVGSSEMARTPHLMAALVSVVALALSGWIAWIFIGSDDMTETKAFAFAVAHSLTAYFTVFGVSYAATMPLSQPVHKPALRKREKRRR